MRARRVNILLTLQKRHQEGEGAEDDEGGHGHDAAAGGERHVL
jgi:hypothetical protein